MIVWKSGTRSYTIDEISDDHLRNIIVMTINSHSFNISVLRREARRRRLFLNEGWRTYANGVIPDIAKQYAKTGEDDFRQVLADLLEEHGSPLHSWMRNSPVARDLAMNIRYLGEEYA